MSSEAPGAALGSAMPPKPDAHCDNSSAPTSSVPSISAPTASHPRTLTMEDLDALLEEEAAAIARLEAADSAFMIAGKSPRPSAVTPAYRIASPAPVPTPTPAPTAATPAAAVSVAVRAPTAQPATQVTFSSYETALQSARAQGAAPHASLQRARQQAPAGSEALPPPAPAPHALPGPTAASTLSAPVAGPPYAAPVPSGAAADVARVLALRSLLHSDSTVRDRLGSAADTGAAARFALTVTDADASAPTGTDTGTDTGAGAAGAGACVQRPLQAHPGQPRPAGAAATASCSAAAGRAAEAALHQLAGDGLGTSSSNSTTDNAAAEHAPLSFAAAAAVAQLVRKQAFPALPPGPAMRVPGAARRLAEDPNPAPLPLAPPAAGAVASDGTPLFLPPQRSNMLLPRRRRASLPLLSPALQALLAHAHTPLAGRPLLATRALQALLRAEAPVQGPEGALAAGGGGGVYAAMTAAVHMVAHRHAPSALRDVAAATAAATAAAGAGGQADAVPASLTPLALPFPTAVLTALAAGPHLRTPETTFALARLLKARTFLSAAEPVYALATVARSLFVVLHGGVVLSDVMGRKTTLAPGAVFGTEGLAASADAFDAARERARRAAAEAHPASRPPATAMYAATASTAPTAAPAPAGAERGGAHDGAGVLKWGVGHNFKLTAPTPLLPVRSPQVLQRRVGEDTNTVDGNDAAPGAPSAVPEPAPVRSVRLHWAVTGAGTTVLGEVPYALWHAFHALWLRGAAPDREGALWSRLAASDGAEFSSGTSASVGDDEAPVAVAAPAQEDCFLEPELSAATEAELLCDCDRVNTNAPHSLLCSSRYSQWLLRPTPPQRATNNPAAAVAMQSSNVKAPVPVPAVPTAAVTGSQTGFKS